MMTPHGLRNQPFLASWPGLHAEPRCLDAGCSRIRRLTTRLTMFVRRITTTRCSDRATHRYSESRVRRKVWKLLLDRGTVLREPTEVEERIPA